MRPSGNPIELADTPNMEKFAEANGYTRIIKSSSKNPSEDIVTPKLGENTMPSHPGKKKGKKGKKRK